MAKVLTIAENHNFQSLEAELSVNGHEITPLSSWIEAVKQIRTGAYDVIIADSYFLCGNTGEAYDPLKEIVKASKEQDMPRVIVATVSKPYPAEKNFPHGEVDVYVLDPSNGSEIAEAIRQSIESI